MKLSFFNKYGINIIASANLALVFSVIVNSDKGIYWVALISGIIMSIVIIVMSMPYGDCYKRKSKYTQSGGQNTFFSVIIANILAYMYLDQEIAVVIIALSMVVVSYNILSKQK